MESPLSVFFRMHWDHEPETRKPFRITRRVFRFMESPHDFDAVHWDHEPVWVVPSVWCPAFRRPGPAKAGTPNRRFMERSLIPSQGVLDCGLAFATIVPFKW